MRNICRQKELEDQTRKLLYYFLAALTIPEDQMWVNLSPYEANRIIPDFFGLTLMGRDLLAQDYILKQLTSSLTSPQEPSGKAFWARIFSKAYQKFDAQKDLSPELLQKVWIVPDHASLVESENGAIIVEAKLKLLTEQDYLALTKQHFNGVPPAAKAAYSLKTEVFRQLILPLIEKEINEGASFASLRQMYHALLLAGWYKKKGMGELLARAYINQQKINGLQIQDDLTTMEVYKRYVRSFKHGVYNFIQDDVDPSTGQTVARKFFSGGTVLNSRYTSIAPTSPQGQAALGQRGLRVTVRLEALQQIFDSAMAIHDKRHEAVVQLARQAYWKARFAIKGARAGWRAGNVVSLEPRVYLPPGILDKNKSWGELFPKSAEILHGIYQTMVNDKEPIIIDHSRSAGSYAATIDRDPQGNPYYFINFGEFSTHSIRYNHPQVLEATFDNLYELANSTAFSDFGTPAFAEYVGSMYSIRPPGLDHLFFASGGGSEANENAIKAATIMRSEETIKLKRPKTKFFIAYDHGFHGRTYKGMSLTSKPIAVDGFLHSDYPKIDFPDSSQEQQRHSLAQVWSLLTTGDATKKDAPIDQDLFNHVLSEIDQINQEDQNKHPALLRIQTPERALALQKKIELLRGKLSISLKEAALVGGIVVEPYQGEGGMNFTDAKYFQLLRCFSTLFDVPLIFDEVQSGILTTGEMWAHQHFNLGIPPDIVTFGKKAGMGGIYMNDRYFVNEPGRLNSTWGARADGIIRFVATEKIIRKEKLDKRIPVLSSYIMGKLNSVQKQINTSFRLPIISNVRSWGLAIGLDFPSKDFRDQVLEQALRRGLRTLKTGSDKTGPYAIRFLARYDTPLYTIDEAVDILKEAVIQVAHDNAMSGKVLSASVWENDFHGQSLGGVRFYR